MSVAIPLARESLLLYSNCIENLKLPACNLFTSLAMASRNMNISCQNLPTINIIMENNIISIHHMITMQPTNILFNIAT